MKKLLLFFLLNFVLSLFLLPEATAQTSVYHPFPDSNAVWHEHVHMQSGPNNYPLFGFIGDTVLNNLTWHKLYQLSTCYICPPITTANSSLIGAIREDSAKCIWFYNINYTFGSPDSISKLYDFSAQAGDTIYYNTNYYMGMIPYMVVDSIDSVYTLTGFRKRFHVGSGFDTWIEGIGSPRALLSPITPMPTCFCIQELVCYGHNDSTYYIKPPFVDCYNFLVDANEISNQQPSVEIYPNPATSSITITSNGATINEIKIYNLLGECVYQSEIRNLKSEISIDISKEKQGIYFVQVKQDNEISKGSKFIITDN